MEKLRLFPNHVSFFDDSKYEEHYTVPVFVPDVPNPNVIFKPHYPKDLVYANNVDLSLEQIKAQKYLQRYASFCGLFKIMDLFAQLFIYLSFVFPGLSL